MIQVTTILKKIFENLKSFSSQDSTFDPSELNDPIAIETEWTPLKKGGVNFCANYLKEISIDRIEFKASPKAKAFYLFLLIGGIGMLTGFTKYVLNNGISNVGLWTSILLLAGICWSAGGLYLYLQGTKPIVFDKVEGYFWKGKKSLYRSGGTGLIHTAVCFDEIYAVQLITEYCEGEDDSFESYEINLILNNAERINVIDHGNLDYIHCDARTLARFLEKPLWNAL